MSEVISALLKRPGDIPRHVNVSNSLEALQKNVEGYFETISFYAIVGRKGTEFADLPVDWKTMKILLANLWEKTDGD